MRLTLVCDKKLTAEKGTEGLVCHVNELIDNYSTHLRFVFGPLFAIPNIPL